MRLYPIGKVEDYKSEDGSAKVISVNNIALGIFNYEGRFYAYENVCAHQGGPVCDGKLFGNAEYKPEGSGNVGYYLSDKDYNIACPWHGIEYDIKTGICRANKKMKLRSFRVIKKESDLYIKM